MTRTEGLIAIYYTIPNSVALATGIAVTGALVRPGARHNFAFVFNDVPEMRSPFRDNESKPKVTKVRLRRRYIYA